MSDNNVPESPPKESEHEAPNQELAEIAELSKKGYQYLKENRIEEAEECFARILERDRENNYALVGLGDAARKHAPPMGRASNTVIL